VQGSGYTVQGTWFRVQGAACRTQGSGFRDADLVVVVGQEQMARLVPMQAVIRLPGNGNSNSDGARPVHHDHLDD